MWLIYAVSWCLKIPVALYKLGGNKNKSTKLLRSKLCMKVWGEGWRIDAEEIAGEGRRERARGERGREKE